jgi:hypothetical protein
MFPILALAACGCRSQPLASATPSAAAATLPIAVEAIATAPQLDFEAHAERVRQRVAGKGFHVVVEPPFVVAGDGGKAAVERAATRTVRWAVRLLRQDFFAATPDRVLEIWLFDGAASYRKHAREWFDDVPTTPYGYYSPRHGALIMNIATGGGTLVHEIVHPFVAADFPACPAWCNEGLGSLFEQCHEVDGHIAGLTNWRLDALQQAIRDQRTIRLSDLVATSRDEFYGARSGLHYAMARYLLYWLQEHDALRGFYRAFRDGAGDDPSGARALREALAVDDLDAFQPQWERWVLALRRE